MFKTVLFPIDQSREVRETADIITYVVNTYGSRLILMSLLEKQGGRSSSREIIISPEMITKLLENGKSLFFQRAIEAEVIEHRGKLAFTICDVADEVNANLIVMGCRGLGLTEEDATDSITNRVIHLSPSPVMIVP